MDPTFAQRFSAILPLLRDPDDPTYAGEPAGSRQQALRNLIAAMPQGQPPMGGPPLTGPTRMASQQPSTPIQSPQGAPQSMVTAPNSGLTGFAPPSGPVLGMGGNGGGQFGGLGTQSPSPGPSESPMAGPLLGKQVTPQSAYNSLNAPRIQAFLQQLAQMQKQIPTLRFS